MQHNNTIEACTSYMTCAVSFASNVDWATLGAIVLLIARLVRDVPDAYDAVVARLPKKKKKRSKGRVKSKR